MRATNDKMRATKAADTEQILRLIQQVPSPNAVHFKIYMAKNGSEWIEETEDSELDFNRVWKLIWKTDYSENIVLLTLLNKNETVAKFEMTKAQNGMPFQRLKLLALKKRVFLQRFWCFRKSKD